LADAQREKEERARQALEKKKVKAKPYLPEPVDPNDDMLKFHAQSVFKRLYLDFLIAHGPCDCKTMAVALANNTNTIMSELIGRIGVAVFFAPMEAFSGVSLGGRLAIGVVKAIASSIYGGQKLSDELIKNLFDVIGGELFPKLVGNNFTGNRINDLAGKDIEEILEAEGVRSIQWEGKTTLRECGEVSGTVTMMINPNTGWVVIMIKIPNCPLIVIKYKVNDDGVAISDPIVRVVK
jgi:hypothetical protein